MCNNLQCRRRTDKNVIREGPLLENSHHEQLSLCFSAEEIRNALWSIPDTKSPGLDGYNSKFYKASWSIIGDEVVEAVQQLFRTGKLLQAWNTTAVHLIPKVPNPNNPGDYRPIACCHTLYKCITKLICSRLKLVLAYIISPSQGAFVEGAQHYAQYSIMPGYCEAIWSETLPS